MNPTEFHDIYGYEYIPYWKTYSFVITMIVLALLTLFACIYFIRRYIAYRYSLKPKLMPWQWVEKELRALTCKEPTSKIEGKLFYSDLTTILKRYFELQFDYKLTDKTDDEVIAYLRAKNFNQELCALLNQIMQGAVTIKFADVQILKQQIEKDISSAFVLIKKLQPQEESRA